MKTPILLIAFACSSFISLFAQEYTPFPLKDARWNKSSSSFSTSCYCSYYYDGDTIVNNLLYSKLYSNCLCYDFITHKYDGSDHFLQGMIREEGKKVYIYRDNKERLIYDFNLSVGDTLPDSDYSQGSIFSSPERRFIVQKIDSVKLLDGKFRKRFICNHPNTSGFDNEIIEGVGAKNLFGSIAPLPGPIYDLGSILDCFSLSDSVVYAHNTSNKYCPLITPITELDNTFIRLSSNVLSAPVQITWEGEPLTFSILNLVGQELYRAEQRYSPHQMEKGSWASGIYFLKVETQNKQFQVFKLFVP